ncbi:hypothetical protein E3P92_02480 [Wallemia ichthyophaga]|uniref:PPM-type phosphatase domain-containing protein n=1 Tax=Wallemia ichthyophaga TaxID=245174 RepID=A0A4T0HAV1_WALIC|nr:hypothetical protein E3P91_02492 [Wallemia ichthyophaga]TIA82295.1 hypothetical protein E3P98_01463 [Wallemia ichthyophaga]TIB11385.1 hypothetical protein E3P90_02436 [Wallemia ichthyophaga]TIB12441.1 hypothetical protein E3P93_02271 [Wallemia ichthyophaga]TIB12686.1 hypothetical protein E3P92_02480 [Wallemia ichthyophaga]
MYVNVRRLSNAYKFRNSLGTGSFAVEPPKAVGMAMSRGQRLYQEDSVSAKVLNLPITPHTLDSQCAYFGIFDGHGGDYVSRYLRDSLPGVIERITTRDWNLIDYFRVYGNYFPQEELDAESATRDSHSHLSLHDRLKLAFLKVGMVLRSKTPLTHSSQADKRTITDAQNRGYLCGSTASVLLLHSLDDPPSPYAFSRRLQLTTAHCGDTCVVLVKAHAGKAHRLTLDDHADNVGEMERLKSFHGALVQDSYGESLFLGQLANTRSIGDAKYKSWGVTPEPHTQSVEVDGDAYSMAILLSDGVTGVVGVQEAADVASSKFGQSLQFGRAAQAAAQAVVDFAIDVGADDNCSAVVVPLPGFANAGKGRDRTRDLRDYRLQVANDPSNVRQKRQ